MQTESSCFAHPEAVTNLDFWPSSFRDSMPEKFEAGNDNIPLHNKQGCMA
jgi:hypothetical protein